MPVWARPEHRASTAHSTLIALGSVLYAGVRKHSQESHRRGSSPITPVFPDAGLKEARTELEVLRARELVCLVGGRAGRAASGPVPAESAAMAEVDTAVEALGAGFANHDEDSASGLRLRVPVPVSASVRASKRLSPWRR